MKKKVNFYIKLIRSLRVSLSFYVKKIQICILKRKYILSRTACLGNDIQASALKKNITKINFQKARVDHLISKTGSNVPLINAFKQICRRDLWPLIYFQSRSFFEFTHKPECIIIDSYSELTDQKFTTFDRQKSFFANYSDVDLTLPGNSFQSDGLLDLKSVSAFYRQLFEQLTNKYGNNVPIFFIHFQTKLDPREKFKARSALIQMVIEDIVKENQFNLSSISINDKQVHQAENDDFYYHYSKSTYDVYISEFISALNKADSACADRLVDFDKLKD